MALVDVVVVWARCINKIKKRLATELELGIMLIA
jgi:hypothetical protein